MKIWNKIKSKVNYVTATIAIAGSFIIVPAAYGLIANVNPAQWAEQLLANAAQKAELLAIQTLQNKIHELENTINGAIQSAVGSAIPNTVQNVLNKGVNAELQRAGVAPAEIDGKVGKVDSAKMDAQTKALADNSKNVMDVIVKAEMQKKQNEVEARLNVSSILDEKPATGACQSVSADKCTILKLIREKDAISMQKLHNQSLASVYQYAMVSGDQWHKVLLETVYQKGSYGAGSEKQKLLNFLTAENSIPLGYDKDLNQTHTSDRARILSDVIAGSKNDMNVLLRSELEKNNMGLSDAAQVDAMSKLAKVQLARNAIINVSNDHLHDTLNSQFKACVARPDVKDTVGNTQEQHLTMIESLLRCTNLSLLQMQQRELEGQRIQGAILLTLLDIYAVQAPTSTK